VSAPGAALPRRAVLGARLPPDAECFSPAGALVIGVAPGSMADDAGVRPGDRLVRLAGRPTRTLAELAAALRAAGGAEVAEVVFTRGDARDAVTVPVRRAPEEAIEGARVEYGAVAVEDGARLRSIVTVPPGAARAPAVLVVQGISCESVDLAGAEGAPLAQLVRGWTRAGMVTMRVDKRGVGDSEGVHAAERDFASELDDARAALAQLAAHPRVDGERVFLFGHSVGGMMAPLLAAERAVAGVMVYGTSTTPWLECVVASQRRQLELRGAPPEVVEHHVATVRARLLEHPPGGRTAAYHRQLQAVDLAAAWARVAAPVLVLRGAYDWVVGAEEQAALAALTGGDLVDLPGLDHLLSWHPSLAASLGAYGEGGSDPEARAVAEAVAWMARAGLRSPA
jgi:dienelactone hydrolase